jgi:hypothetical protein
LLQHRLRTGRHARDASGARPISGGTEVAEGDSDRRERVAIELIGRLLCGVGVNTDDAREPFILEQGEQQMLGADPPVATATGLVPGVFDSRSRRLSEPFKHRRIAFRISREPIDG